VQRSGRIGNNGASHVHLDGKVAHADRLDLAAHEDLLHFSPRVFDARVVGDLERPIWIQWDWVVI
jgi:hypothetical protein